MRWHRYGPVVRWCRYGWGHTVHIEFRLGREFISHRKQVSMRIVLWRLLISMNLAWWRDDE